MRSMADRIKPGVMELGGKNAMVVYPDADPAKVAVGATVGMNFTTTSGQSCMSNSRVFLHEDIYDAALGGDHQARERAQVRRSTGSSDAGRRDDEPRAVSKVLDYIELGKQAGARVACGGGPPADEALANGLFVEPTVLVDVTQDMRVAQEEIFGPVMSVLRWEDEATMLEQVNSVELRSDRIGLDA